MPRPAPVPPGPGQESVWDYPRPPRVEVVPERIRVIVDAQPLADTTSAMRVIETAGAPVYYIPPSDVDLGRLVETAQRSSCEWKGEAFYLDYDHDGRRVGAVAWRYPVPSPGYEPISGYLAFYAGRVDEAWVGEERAIPQPGGFYGGWVTSRIAGPIKGGPGSEGW